MLDTSTHVTPILVEKENIPGLVFPSDAVERSKDDWSILRKKLRDSMVLGNIHHNKIKIIFKDDEGLKEVRTTIWAAGEQYIVLKKGVAIPVHRVVDIKF